LEKDFINSKETYLTKVDDFCSSNTLGYESSESKIYNLGCRLVFGAHITKNEKNRV
jgi:hypothetical protein